MAVPIIVQRILQLQDRLVSLGQLSSKLLKYEELSLTLQQQTLILCCLNDALDLVIPAERELMAASQIIEDVRVYQIARSADAG